MYQEVDCSSEISDGQDYDFGEDEDEIESTNVVEESLLEAELGSQVAQLLNEDWGESKINEVNYYDLIISNNETIVHNIMPKMPDDENKCTKQDHDEDELIFREYQLDMFNQGKGKNSIIYLETGLGKTLIIIMFMWQQLMTYPNKKIVFLANTIQLVEQQAQQISIKLPRVAKLLSDDHKSTELAKDYIKKMKVIHGSKYPDSWNRLRWSLIFEQHQIFVMTSQVFLNLLRKGQLKMIELSFIAFDECHAASSDHQYSYIMKEFYFQTKQDLALEGRLQELPQLVGATASPIISSKSVNQEQVLMDLLNLAARLDSMFVYSDEEIVKQHLKEARVEYLPYNKLSGKEEIQKYIDNGTCRKELSPAILSWMSSQKYLPEYFRLKMLLESFKGRTRQDIILQSMVTQLQEYLLIQALHIYLELGPYTIILTLDLVISKMKLFRDNCLLGMDTVAFDELVNQLIALQHDCVANYQNIYTAISPKMQVLVTYLKQIYSKDPQSMALIFIKQRLTAYYLDKLLQLYLQHAGLNNIKSSYIIGQHGKHNATVKPIPINQVVDDQRGTLVNNLMQELKKDTNKFNPLNEKVKSMKILLLEQHLNVAQQKEILMNFRSQQINILISTSVAEEGIDIPMCNFVICFNSVASSKAFVQMKGRARKADSCFIIMVPEQNEVSKSQTHQKVQQYTKQQIKYFISPNRRVQVMSAISVIQKKLMADPSYEQYIIQQSGANINSNWSLQLMTNFCQSIQQEGGQQGQPKYATFQINRQKGLAIYLAFILLPFQINQFIYCGNKHSSVKAARTSAAVMAAKTLYQNGYINEELRATLQDNIGIHLGADEEDQSIEQTGEQINIIRKYCKIMVKQTNLLGLTLKVCQRFYQSTLNNSLKSYSPVSDYMKCKIEIKNIVYILATPDTVYKKLIEAAEILSKHQIVFVEQPQTISLDEFTKLFNQYTQQAISQFKLMLSGLDVYQETVNEHQFKFTLRNQAFFVCLNPEGSLNTAFSLIIRAMNVHNCSQTLRKREIQTNNKIILTDLSFNDLLSKIPQHMRTLAINKVNPLHSYIDTELSDLNRGLIVQHHGQQKCQILNYFDDILINCLDADNINRAQIIIGMTYFKMLVALQVYANYLKTDIRITHVKSKTLMSATYLKNCLMEIQIFQYLNKTDSNNSLLTKLTQIVRFKEQEIDLGFNFETSEQILSQTDKCQMIIQNNPYYSHFSIGNFVDFIYGSFGYIKSKVEDQQLKDGFKWLQWLNICKLDYHLESTEELANIKLKDTPDTKYIDQLREEYQKLQIIIQYSFNNFEILFRALTDVSFKLHMNNRISSQYQEKFQTKEDKALQATDELLQQFITEASQIYSNDQNSYCNQTLSYLGKYLWNYAIHPQLQDKDLLKVLILRKIFGSIPFQAYMAIRLRLDIYLNVGPSKQINEAVNIVQSMNRSSIGDIIDQVSVNQGTEMLANAFRALVAAIYFDCGCDFAELSNWCSNICLRVNCAQLFHDDYIRRQPRYQFLKWYEATLKQDPFNFKLLRTPHQDYKKEAFGIMLFIPFDSQKSEIVNLLQDKFYDITQLHIYEKSRNKAWDQLLKFIPEDVQYQS